MSVRKYLYDRRTKTKQRLNGVIPSTRLPHKEKLSQSFSARMLYINDQLPPKVDLRSALTAVENQSKIGSCTANSLAGAYEYLLKKAKGKDIDVSRLFIYYNGRSKKKNTTTVTDAGCSMTHAIEALEESGVCLESLWPYDITNVNTRPSDEAYEQAKDYQITEALKLNIDLQEMKSCLAQGFPFAFALMLCKSFDKAKKTGVVPMPNLDEEGREEHDSHAMLAVGYSDQSKAFIVRNSWGTGWGDKGYCYIPYDYMTNTKFCFDAWTIRQIETGDLGDEHWDHDDSIDYQAQRDDNDDDNNDDHYEIRVIDEDDDDTSSTSSSSSSSKD